MLDSPLGAPTSLTETLDVLLTHFRSGGCGPADPSGYLPAITCPTLILAGQDDPVVPAAAARRLATLFPQAPVTLEVMADVGHGTFRQATRQAFAHVRRFIIELTCPPPTASG